MRKILSAALVICLLLTCASALADTTATLNQAIATRTGPGTHYTEPGGFLGRGDKVTVRTKVWDEVNEIWWVQVEFAHQGNKIRAYTGAWRMSVNLAHVQVEEELRSCRLIFDADAFAGPGWEYMMWNDTVYRGTQAILLEVENGYGHIECWNSQQRQMWRVWVDLDTLDCGDLYGGGSYSGSEEDPYTCDDYESGLIAQQYPEYMPYVPSDNISPSTYPRESIMWVQQCLRRLDYGQLAVDGKWGNQTTNAVAQFKRDYGFTHVPYNEVNYAMVCKMLQLYVQRSQPLNYLSPYCN